LRWIIFSFGPYNLASARHPHTMPCLVLKSTLVHIEVPTCLLPTMTALVAVGNCPISIYQPETPPTTPGNIVLEGWSGFHFNTSPSIITPHSTLNNLEHYVENPTPPTNDHSNHHDQQPINLAVICCKIECRMSQWEDLFATLAPVLKGDAAHSSNTTNSIQQSIIMMMMMTMVPLPTTSLMAMPQPLILLQHTTLDGTNNLQDWHQQPTDSNSTFAVTTIEMPMMTMPSATMLTTIMQMIKTMMTRMLLQLILHHHHTLDKFQCNLQLLTQPSTDSIPSSPASTGNTEETTFLQTSQFWMPWQQLQHKTNQQLPTSAALLHPVTFLHSGSDANFPLQAPPELPDPASPVLIESCVITTNPATNSLSLLRCSQVGPPAVWTQSSHLHDTSLAPSLSFQPACTTNLTPPPIGLWQHSSNWQNSTITNCCPNSRLLHQPVHPAAPRLQPALPLNSVY